MEYSGQWVHVPMQDRHHQKSENPGVQPTFFITSKQLRSSQRVWKELLASLAIVPFLRVQHVVALTKDENLRYMTEDVCSFEA